LQQGQHAPLSLALQVALLIALADGFLDRVPLERIAAFRSELAAWLQPRVEAILRNIAQLGKLAATERQELGAALSQLAEMIGAERDK